MITEFGKALRKLRIDKDELLKDMASKLDVTISYLSAVENGRREVPQNWVDDITILYGLNAKERDKLENLAYKSKKRISINLESADSKRKDVALAFARKFDDFSDEEIRKINSIIKGKGD